MLPVFRSRALFPLTAVCLLAAAPGFAALSPWYDRAEQIGAILGSEAIAGALGQRPVDSLEYEGQRSDGTVKWEIESEGCDLDVYLVPSPPEAGMVGKTTYQIREPLEPCR